MTRIKLVLFVGVIAAMLSAGLLMWKAEATPLAGSVEPFTINQSVSPVAQGRLHVRNQQVPRRQQMGLHAQRQRRRRNQEMQVHALLGGI